MMEIKHQVENYLDKIKIVVPAERSLIKLTGRHKYKNREAVYNAFNSLGAVNSLKEFEAIWAETDGAIFQCVKEDCFVVVFDYKKQSETNAKSNVYYLK